MKTLFSAEYLTIRILAEPTRFRIYKLLIDAKNEVCHCEFVDALEVPKYTLSKHLDVLLKAGLIRSRKEGRWVYFSISDMPNELVKTVHNAKASIHERDLTRLQKRFDIRVNGKCLLGVQGRKLMKCC